MQFRAYSWATKARSNYGKLPMRKKSSPQFRRKIIRTLISALVLFGGAPSAAAWAQDAMSDRYAAIRAPTEALIGRIGQTRLQADIDALMRERSRVQGRLRQTEYLRFQDPVSGLAAAERALDASLDRIGAEIRDTRARLVDQVRRRPGSQVAEPQSAQGFDADPSSAGTGPGWFGELPMADSVDAARIFVEDLLRANRARQ